MPPTSVRDLASPFKHLLADSRTTSATFRHLLRDLLRETTYLPDPWLRTYTRSYILSRYRAYLKEPVRTRNFYEVLADDNPEHPDLDRRDEFLNRKRGFVRKSARRPERQHHLFLQAREELRKLVRANLGHEKPLFSVMCRAYGRRGERRMGLLGELWQAEVPESSEELAAIIEAQKGSLFVRPDQPRKDVRNGQDNKPVDGAEQGWVYEKEPHKVGLGRDSKPLLPKPVIPELPAAVRALAKAQNASGVENKLRLAPVIPLENAWGRPFPVVRKRKLIREWLLNLKSNLLPPLPEDEFVRLRNLVKARYNGLETPQLARNMPPIVKTRVYHSPFHQPHRRPMGTVRVEWRSPRLDNVDIDDPSIYDTYDLNPDDADCQSDYSDINAVEEDHSRIPLNPDTVERYMVRVRGAHYLTEKYLRRLYAQMLDLACRMWKDERGQLRVEWGREGRDWIKKQAVIKAAQEQDGPMIADSTGGHSSDSAAPTCSGLGGGERPIPERPHHDAWLFRAEDPMEAGK